MELVLEAQWAGRPAKSGQKGLERQAYELPLPLSGSVRLFHDTTTKLWHALPCLSVRPSAFVPVLSRSKRGGVVSRTQRQRPDNKGCFYTGRLS